MHKKLNDVTYLIGDATGQARLSFSENSDFGMSIAEGRFVKLLNPVFDVTKGEFALMSHATALKCTPIVYKPLDEKNLPETSLGSFEGLDELMSSSTFPTIISKVIFVSHERTSKDGAHRFCTVALKDHKGNRVAANLSGRNLEKVDWDVVYKFHNFKVTTYKGEKRLASGVNSEISEVDEEVANLFPPRGGEDTDDGCLKGIENLLAPYDN